MQLKLLALFCLLQSIAAYQNSDFIFYPPQTPTTRIVGGIDAEDGQAPFQCSLQGYSGHFCGCSILSPNWIATAAHCVAGRTPKDFKVLVGTNSLKNGNGTFYNVEKFTAHESYDNPNFANDIAVIRTKETIEFTKNVQPIKYSKTETPDGALAQLTGWGRLSTGGAVPDQLQVINLNVISTVRCRAINGVSVHESHICTLNKAGEGACYGDSGGPLIHKNELIGIVNWGRPCAQGYPDAYAKVSYLADWIKEHTGL